MLAAGRDRNRIRGVEEVYENSDISLTFLGTWQYKAEFGSSGFGFAKKKLDLGATDQKAISRTLDLGPVRQSLGG